VAGINLLLSDYTLLVCQLEQSLMRGELTNSFLQKYCRYSRSVTIHV